MKSVGKRVLGLLLAMVLIGGVSPVTVNAAVGIIPDGYTPIYTAQNLSNIRNNLSGKYILMNDIDLTNFGNWTPLGIMISGGDTSAFKGVFDGNGFTIRNVRLRSPFEDTNYVTYDGYGLFGYISNATISNLTIAGNWYFNAGAIWDRSMGMIVGESNNSTIFNCKNACVKIELPRGQFGGSGNIGGIIGTAKNTSIINCHNSGAFATSSYIKSMGTRYGGIVGSAFAAEIAGCTNVGNITSGDTVAAGGICGEGSNGTSIFRCSNAGDILTENESFRGMIGGIVGSLYSYSDIYADLSISIRNCYNAGSLQGGTAIGGIMGGDYRENIYIGPDYSDGVIEIVNCYNIGQTPTNGSSVSGSILGEVKQLTTIKQHRYSLRKCYYINENTLACGAVNDANRFSADSVSALSDVQLRQETSYIDFDFENVWKIDLASSYAYPQFRYAYTLAETIPATCTAIGRNTYVCMLTGFSYVETTGLAPHAFVTVTDFYPACTAPGTAHEECTGCGIQQNYQTIPATGHNPGEWETTKTPTCTTQGQQVKKCATCQLTLETATLPIIGHMPGIWQTTQAATCTTPGEQIKKCTACSAIVETGTIAASGHTLGNWETTKQPTSAEPGEQMKKCTVCGTVLERESIPATGGGSQSPKPNTIFGTKWEATPLNWILFFVCFGWLWMWF